MTVLDMIVVLVLGVTAVGGFWRGLVQEVLSLAAWILAAFAIYYLHQPLTTGLEAYLESEPTTSILAFALLLLIPYAAMKVIANNVGQASRNSIVGPIDRVLGFGFGALKGALIVVIGFSILFLGYDTAWGYKGRPEWMVTARTYPFVDAGSRTLVKMVADRHDRLQAEAEELE